jgi:hydrogenase nickel incorporation protein HypA/HybF
MHELSITQSMVELALGEGKKAGAKKIGKINLVIGEMSGVVDESVSFYFGFLSKDTIAEGATLEFKRVPMTTRCKDCGNEFTPKEFDWTCPKCKGAHLDVIAGDELRIESIEVE